MPGSPPRKINLNKEVMLPVATESLWRVTAVDNDRSTYPPALWLVAAHGGAGCTMLSEMLAFCGDAGQVWPIHDEYRFCVVVAKSTMRGLERAHQVVLQGLHTLDEITIIGVIIIADAVGKLPKALINKLEVIEKLVTVWQIPYLPALRIVEEGTLATWTPGDEIDVSRKARKRPPTESCPISVATIGKELFATVKSAHSGNMSGTSSNVEATEEIPTEIEGEDDNETT